MGGCQSGKTPRNVWHDPGMSPRKDVLFQGTQEIHFSSGHLLQ